MARTATIIGTTLDIDGAPWDVREDRPTKHGFPILIGWPEGCRGKGYGGPRVIPTPEIRDFFERNRLRRDGMLYDLPISRTAIKRVRRLLGFDFYVDNREWWEERIDDLCNMPGVRFARVHGVSPETASTMRVRLVGRRFREPFWYREEKPAQMLKGDLPRAFVADKLGISVGTVGRLRWLLRSES